MHTVHHPELRTLLETLRPASILLLDPNPEALPPDWTAAHPDCPVHRITGPDPLTQLENAPRCDLGVVANTLEHLDPDSAGRLLGRLRDLKTRRFVALVPLGQDWPGLRSHWSSAGLLAYGLSRIARYRVDNRPVHLYHYAIETYKTTPEWFNSRHWAHPENWQP